ncbi:MAG TPA: hypothetical protein VFB10_08710 [Candidatus Dormibacteraeota bacterium]|nr:hypothetical protein [Candidatus Dormibacteraeota bacterium]
MADKVKRVFHYHASGLALSGSFTRPISRLIEVQAPTVLPTIGGYGNARVENFRLDHHVHFKAGYSHVAGSKLQKSDKEFYTTLVTATVEGLNLLDVVTAERIVMRLSVYHVLPDDESHFSFVGSTIENLKIGGHPVELEQNERLFAHLDTFEKIKKELETDKEFKRMAEDPFHSGTPTPLSEGHGELLCSLVKKIKTNAPGVSVEGHALVIPDFGRIYLAEALLSSCKRTLTMLRFELGSPVEGNAVVSQGIGNGIPWP